jgi:hypothetical protein
MVQIAEMLGVSYVVAAMGYMQSGSLSTGWELVEIDSSVPATLAGKLHSVAARAR